jgi:hypothetical protein
MTLRGSLLAGIGALVVIHLATAFGAIGLLTRMSPAVRDILAENVYSIEAAEDVLMVLTSAAAADSGDHASRFEGAIGRARANVTELDEVPAIDDLERCGAAALAGDPAALVGAVAAADRLIAINRDAMQRASLKALNLGVTGAWAAVVLALAGFLIGAFVIRRIVRGVVEPVEELARALAAHGRGDRFRRCQARSASQEMRQVFGAVNTLLDYVHRVSDDRLNASKM